MSSVSSIEKLVQAMVKGFQPAKAGGLKVVYALRLTGEGGGTWAVAVGDGKCSVSAGAPPRAETVIVMSTDHYVKLAAGKLNAVEAYNRGEIKVEGNLEHARRFLEIFSPWAAQVLPEAPAPPPQPPPAPGAPKPAPAKPTLADYARAMPGGFRPDKAGSLAAIYQFQLTGSGGGTWSVTVAKRACAVSEGETAPPGVTIRMSGSDFIKLARGQLDTTRAYQEGKITISGDTNLAARFSELFGAWAGSVEVAPRPAPTPAPRPTPAPAPTPQPRPTPAPAGPVNPTLLNGSFDEYQPYIRDGEARFWKEPQFPERYGDGWTVEAISEGKRRLRLMDSEVFGRFTQAYYGGGGRDYHIHGKHSQVITSRYAFDVVFMQTVAAQPGREYTFAGSVVTYYQGTSGAPVHDKIFKRIGIDPTGGRDYSSPSVAWGERDGRDNEWRYPVVRARAQANAITVFIRLENTEEDVGTTELNIIHLDDFKLEAVG